MRLSRVFSTYLVLVFGLENWFELNFLISLLQLNNEIPKESTVNESTPRHFQNSKFISLKGHVNETALFNRTLKTVWHLRRFPFSANLQNHDFECIFSFLFRLQKSLKWCVIISSSLCWCWSFLFFFLVLFCCVILRDCKEN